MTKATHAAQDVDISEQKLALGRTWLQTGWVDACLVGGGDILSPTAIAAFYNLR
jgi:3-oxoacyl-(acyl-carrier-protein) synthase